MRRAMFKFFKFVSQIIQLLVSAVASIFTLVAGLGDFVVNIGNYASLPVVNLVLLAISVYIVIWLIGRKGSGNG